MTVRVRLRAWGMDYMKKCFYKDRVNKDVYVGVCSLHPDIAASMEVTSFGCVV